jgi:hypothetical protein
MPHGGYDIEWIKDWRTATGGLIREGIAAHQEARRTALTTAQAPDKAGEREGLEAEIARLRHALVRIADQRHSEGCEPFDKALDLADSALTPQPNGTEASRGVGAQSEGWLYHNPDTGTEWSVSHPVESGEVDDAENIRPATLDAFREEMFAAWKMLEEMRQERDAATPTPPLSPDSTGQDHAMQRIAERASKLKRRIPLLHGKPLPLEVKCFEEGLDAIVALTSIDTPSQAAALTPSAPIAAPVRDDGARERVVQAMQSAWDEWVRDTGCFPGDFRVERGPKLFFEAGQWASLAADEILASLPTPAGDVPGEAQTEFDKGVAFGWKSASGLIQTHRDMQEKATADCRDALLRKQGLSDELDEALAMLRDANEEIARLDAVLKRVADPRTIMGMHDQDRAPKLQRIAQTALPRDPADQEGAP